MSPRFIRKPLRILRNLLPGFDVLPASKRGKKRLALVLFCAGLGAVLAYLPQMGLSAQMRAQKWSEEAVQAYTDGDFEAAGALVASARKVDPEDKVLALLDARIALRLNREDVLELWKPLISSANVTTDDLSDLAWHLADRGRYDEVNRLLPIILERDPKGSQARELYLDSLVRDYQYSQVEKIARGWLEEGEKSWYVHKALADVLLRDPRSEKNAEGRVHLRSLLSQNDDVGIEAIRYLIRITPDPMEKADLIERLQAHPRVSLQDQYFLATWKYLEAETLTFAAALREVRSIINPSQSEGQKQFLRWLAGVGRYNEILNELPRTEALGDEVLNELYFEALLVEEQPEEIIDATREQTIHTLALDEVKAQLYRARAFAATGNEEGRDKALDWAMTLAKDEEIVLVELTLRRLQLTEHLEAYYWRLLSQASTADFAAPRILRLNYEQADEISLAKALELIEFEMMGDNPGSRLFLAYLNMLYQPARRLESIQEVEDIIARFPGIVESQLMLAFSYKLQGQERNVERFLNLLPESPPTQNFRYLQIAYFVLNADSINVENLDLSGFLPRERALVNAALGAS